MGDDPEVRSWLVHRRIDPSQVEDRDLARALPREGLPMWARHWSRRAARCILPVYGPSGEFVTLRGRVVTLPRPTSGPKVLAVRAAPPGVLADGTARALLRGDDWIVAAGVQDALVCEGEVDWLIRSAWVGEEDSAPPVFGMLGASGWSAWLGGRIPDGWRVTVEADRDEPGEALLQKIAPELGSRCTVIRGALMRSAR